MFFAVVTVVKIRPDGKTIGNYVHEQSWSVGDVFPAAGLDVPA